MRSNPGDFQVEHIPESPCVRFQMWYAGSKARRHTTECRAKAVMDAIPMCFENSKILEVGSGWGYLSFVLANRGASVTSTDIEVGDVHFGSRVRKLNNYDGAIRFCAADALTLPFKDEAFDVTISMEMIEHVPGGPGKVCSEFARVTRPNGFVVLSTPNPNGVAQVVKEGLKRVPALRRRYSFLDYEEWFLSPAEVLSATGSACLKPVTLRRTGLTVPFVPDWLFPFNLAAEKAFNVLPMFLTTNIFVFQRY